MGQFRALRPEHLAKTDNNACAALLLDLFEYWTQVRSDNSAQAESGGKEGNDLWFYRSLADLNDDLFGSFGRAAIRTALQLLIDKGLVESRTNPSSPWDRTLQYRTLDGAKPNDVQGAESDDDAGARPSQPLAAREVSAVEEEREKKNGDSQSKPQAKPRTTYNGKPVPDPVVNDAEALLRIFNAQQDRRLSLRDANGRASPHLTQVIGALRANPEATRQEWEDGMRRVIASPPEWAQGRVLQLGDVFGPKAAAYTLTPASAQVVNGSAKPKALNANGNLDRFNDSPW